MLIFKKLHKKIINKLKYLLINVVGSVLVVIKIKSALYFPYALIPLEYIILCVLSPLVKVRVGELESRAIGHFSLPVEIYLSERDLKLHGTHYIDLFYINKDICNTFLFKKWQELFNIGPRYFLEPFYVTVQKFHPRSRFLTPYRHWRNTDLWQLCDLHASLPRTVPHLVFTEDEKRQAEESLIRLGVGPLDEIVCFHARDPNFREGPTAKFSFRDSQAGAQYEAMEAIAKRGMKAIRMGRNMRDQLNSENPNIIDYSYSQEVSDLTDIYTCSRASFVVCTGSGLEVAALMFRVPLVCVNIAQWGLLHYHDNEQYPLFIPKKQIWQQSKIPLSLSDIQSINSHRFTSDAEYHKAGIELVENTPSEIHDVVVEFDLRRRGMWSTCLNEEKLQEEFQRKLHCYHERRIPMRLGSKYLSENRYLLI